MKNSVWLIVWILCVPFLSRAQGDEATQLLLDVQKLSELKQMLSELKEGYQVIYKGYTTIKNISEGNHSLHKLFLDGLLQVSPAVRNYKKVADIISLQLRMISEYKSALHSFKKNGMFAPGEMDYMEKLYSGLFNETANGLETLALILTPGALRMSDAERLKQIDGLFEDMVDQLSFLRHFNSQASLLALQRARDQNQTAAMKKIYGLNN